MLQFYYDCIDKFCSRQEFELISMYLSYNSNINAYSWSYQCISCEQFKRRCENKTKLKCSGGFHDQWRNIFEQLDEYDIHVYSDIGHYPYFIVFDFKAIRHAIDETQLGTL